MRRLFVHSTEEVQRLYLGAELTDPNEHSPLIAYADSLEQVRELVPWASEIVETPAGWYAFESADEAWAFRRRESRQNAPERRRSAA
jgi:hypothetical protein